MEIIKHAVAGTLESSDLMVTAAPYQGGRKIEINSVVAELFYDDIKTTIENVLDEYSVSDIHLQIDDKGAFDFTVRARAEAAILQAGGKLKC